MIRRLFKAKSDISVRSSHHATANQSKFGQFEQLEEKRCLAFVGFFDGITLTLEQTVDDGDVVVDNSGISNAFRVTDNSGTLAFVPAENLIVEMLDNTANQINLNANFQHNGSVTIEAGHGPRDIQFTGNNFPFLGPNVFTGDVTVNAGDSIQNILWTPVIGNPITVGGNFSVNTGFGFDTIFNSENFATVGGNVDLVGVNNFIFTDFLFPVPLDAYMTVGGNFTMDTSNESVESFYLDNGTFLEAAPDPDEERTVVGGNFTYIGGDDIDHVDLNNIHIRGNLDIDLGEGIPFFGDPQNLTTTFLAPRVLDGEGGGPYFELNGDARIAAGDASLDNIVNLSGYFDGNTVNFEMGGLVDIVTYNWIGRQADVIADMGAGDDVFTLNQHLNSLIIDFGNDPGDTFINNIGKFTFDADFLNFHWFDHMFTVGDDTLALTQLIDTGDVTIDNTGGITGVAWQVTTPLGTAAATTPANNLILNMLDNTGNNVFIDLANPVLAFLTLNLGDGDRNVDFIGASNNPLRDITIIADAGNQNVELSVNAPLAVATLNVSLGSGFDTVDDDANNLMLSEDLVFSGVNLFENDGILSIGRDVFINTVDDSTDNIFANNSSMIVVGTFAYTGGDGRDELRLNGPSGNSIGSTTTVSLGDNIAGGTQMFLIDAPSTFIGGPLTVTSTNAGSDDVFASSPAASLIGDVFVDLGDGDNWADITGLFGGSEITYNGGDQVDTVVLGTTGNAANINIDLKQGDDVLTLLAGTAIQSPFIVNFGGNADTFNNLYGPFTFDAELLGLNGFNHFFDLTDSKLTSTQIADQGDVVIDNNGTLNSIRFTTGGSTSEIAPVTNMEVNMLGGTGNNLDIDWDTAYVGDLEVNLGSSPRVVSFTGDDNSIGGTLLVTAGSGEQTVNLATSNAMSVGGNSTIELGLDADVVTDSGNAVTVGGNYSLVGANTYMTGGLLAVAGDLSINNGIETLDSTFNDMGVVNVGGNFGYVGSEANDIVVLDELSVFGGNISANMSNGDNTADLRGNVTAASTIIYTGGTGVDLVTMGMLGASTDVNVALGAGDDTFEILAGVDLSSLFVDFGTGNDTFINPNGPFTFPATLLNLNGFNHVFDPIGASLTSVQVEASGDVTFDNNGAGNAFQITNDAGTQELGAAAHLDVTMLDDSGDHLTIDLDSALTGNLTVALGAGDRLLNMSGTDNSVGGAANITGGDGVQSLAMALNSELTVGMTLDIDLGNGADVMTLGNDMTVAGDANLLNVNAFTNNGSTSIGGNLNVDNSAEMEDSSLIDAAILGVTGDFNYTGGSANDTVTLNSSTNIGGNIDINAGDGDNDAAIMGIFGGTTIRYNGGAGTDNVTLENSGNDANVNVRLSTGDDTFVLAAGANVATDLLRVDFGGGDDTLINNYGAFDFNATILNLDGYNAFYDVVSGNLDVTQIADTGDVTIDNNGAGAAIRIGDGVGPFNELTPATDLRLIMQDNTSGNVTADFDNTRGGNTTIQLKSGDRDVFFTGSSNTYNGLFRVEAADGVQNVHVSVNAPLNVTGTAVVNTRDAGDTVAAANAVNVSGAMLLRGVNTFVNNAGLNVGSDFNVITLLEDQDTKLVSNASFVVGGNISYLGGGGVDTINFKTNGANVSGFVYIDIGTSSDLVNKQNIKLTGAFSTSSLVIDGGTGAAGNFVTIGSSAFVDSGGLVVVNFASSTSSNTVEFRGNYAGTYGTYRGGSGSDFVVLGASASNLEFANITGDGDDVFVVETTTDVNFLYGDMGAGSDSLDNQFGTFPFANNVFNL